jgi:hypothetical protein
MKKLIFSLLVFLTGCQSMGEHFTCLDEANRITRTEQRFVRTETKCVRSDQQSLGGGQGTIYNPGRGDVNCTSTPIYETVILNQSERDAVYQNCRNRINNQNLGNQNVNRTSSTSSTQNTTTLKQKLSADTPFCQALLKSDGINGSTYKSHCEVKSNVSSTNSCGNLNLFNGKCVSDSEYEKLVDERNKKLINNSNPCGTFNRKLYKDSNGGSSCLTEEQYQQRTMSGQKLHEVNNTNKCNSQGEIQCQQQNMKCVSSGATQWCSR